MLNIGRIFNLNVEYLIYSNSRQDFSLNSVLKFVGCLGDCVWL